MLHTDLLILIYPPEGRDPEAIIPLTWYLENVFYYRVKYGSVFDCCYLIDKYKPKVLILNNMSGSEFNALAADYAFDKGVLVVTLTSEGLFRKTDMEGFIWGNMREKRRNWNKMFVWSEHYLGMTKKFLPEYFDSFDVSGSTGIDRYVIYKFLSKKEFFKKYKKENFKKIVMYGGFSFGYFFNDTYIDSTRYSSKDINYYRMNMKSVKKIILQMISNNPDILFILKKHPGEDNLYMEIDYDWQRNNILIFDDQEDIADLINVSDIYFVYRSTTSFEAYALKKPVINIFPAKDLAQVQPDQLGNCLVKNYSETQKIIDEYYRTGKVKEFEKKSEIRKKIISNSVGSLDGLNSYRTAVKIDKYIKKQKNIFKGGMGFKGLLMHLVLKYNFLLQIFPRFKNSDILKKYNEFSKFYDLKKKYVLYIRKFYQNKIS